MCVCMTQLRGEHSRHHHHHHHHYRIIIHIITVIIIIIIITIIITITLSSTSSSSSSSSSAWSRFSLSSAKLLWWLHLYNKSKKLQHHLAVNFNRHCEHERYQRFGHVYFSMHRSGGVVPLQGGQTFSNTVYIQHAVYIHSIFYVYIYIHFIQYNIALKQPAPT